MRARLRSKVAFGAALAMLLAYGAPAHALQIVKTKLSNGAVLLVSKEHQLPMVTVAIAFDAGARRDPPGKDGLASLTAQCLQQGTRELTSEQFNRKIDFMGSNLSIGAGSDWTIASFKSLKRYAPQTLHLLAQLLTNPGLRTADILRKRAQAVADIKAERQDPGYVASVTFREALFGNGPYGHPPEGEVSSVEKLTPTDVRNFYKRYYRLGSAVIAVVGDVKTSEMKSALEKELAQPAGTVPAQTTPPTPIVPKGVHAKLVDRNIAQANIVLGFGGIARSNPDFYRLRVMNYILGGGGFASRLVKSVRTKAGLAYSVASFFSARKFPGAFQVVLQTRNRGSNEALRLVIQQLHKIQEKPVTQAELESAKKFLIGSFPLKLDRQSSIASFMLDIELNHLGLDYADRYPKLIQAVTVQDVQRMARKYLHPDSLILVAVANQKKAAINLKQVAAEAKAD